MTAVGPGSRRHNAARDRSGGQADDGDRGFTGAAPADPIVTALRLALREIAAKRVETRATLTVLDGRKPGGQSAA